MQTTGILIDRRYLNHSMGFYHVENPKRLEVILDMIDREIRFPYYRITPRPASEEELLWTHTQEHIDRIRSTAGKESVILDPDTSTSALSFETARLAAGGLLQSLEHILDGTINNALAPVRPPGHHAEAHRAMGFCIFNNIAIAAEWLIRSAGLTKVLIVDWDLHHGNGTQNSFWERSDVLYFSSHQFPHYPGSGHWSESGAGEGEGFTLNVPLYAGKTDAEYLYIFKKILVPAARKFAPEAILVSAGFDVAAADPLGGMEITGQGFASMTYELMTLARDLCQGRLLIALEGGYDLSALANGTKEVLGQLSGTVGPPCLTEHASPQLLQELGPALDHFTKFWDLS